MSRLGWRRFKFSPEKPSPMQLVYLETFFREAKKGPVRDDWSAMQDTPTEAGSPRKAALG